MFRPKRNRRLFAVALFLVSLTTGSAFAQVLAPESLRIPATFEAAAGKEKVWLEALMVRPSGPGAFPLAILNHGSPRDRADARRLTPQSMLPQAMEFARRGWAAVILMRRGYGSSEGEIGKEYGSCQAPDYEAAGRSNADDIREAIRFMAAQRYVDGSHIISVGVSAGGFATVALAADPPPGLVAAINFAGGRGSLSDDKICSEERLIGAFAGFGRTARIPMLWVYAANDHFFGPRAARKFYDAFTAGGGQASFVAAPAFGTEGHFLFSQAGVPVWMPIVEDFLARNRLQMRSTPLDLASSKAVPPPASLSVVNREVFQNFLAAPPNKAFAVAANGAFGWRSARRSAEDAEEESLALCAKNSTRQCRVYMVNDRLK